MKSWLRCKSLAEAVANSRDLLSLEQANAAVAPGDRVYLWQRGLHDGIYAQGDVVSSGKEDGQAHVEYRRLFAVRPILRQALEREPGVAKLATLESREGELFAVTEEEDKLLQQLIEKRPTTWLEHE